MKISKTVFVLTLILGGLVLLTLAQADTFNINYQDLSNNQTKKDNIQDSRNIKADGVIIEDDDDDS